VPDIGRSEGIGQRCGRGKPQALRYDDGSEAGAGQKQQDEFRDSWGAGHPMCSPTAQPGVGKSVRQGIHLFQQLAVSLAGFTDHEGQFVRVSLRSLLKSTIEGWESGVTTSIGIKAREGK
jgi:hypothetical protein